MSWHRGVQFLEVRVWKSGSRYNTMPCLKSTSLGIPLDVTSANPPRVHLRWPVDTTSRVQGLSTHREHADSAEATLVDRFRRHTTLPVFLINLLDRTLAWKSNFGPTFFVQVPNPMASLGLPPHFAPNLEQSSCGADHVFTVAATLQHSFG